MRIRNSGFTMIEILVAMVILAIGLLGMAAMSILAVRGNKGASDLTSATNVCQLKLEELKDVSWDELGNNNDPTNANSYVVGLQNADLRQQTSLNGQGKTRDTVIADLVDSGAAGDATEAEPMADQQGPYKFTRTFLVCRGSEYTAGNPPVPPTGSTVAVTPRPNEPPATVDCEVTEDDASRTRAVACVPEDIATSISGSNKEKKIKVLCTWRSSDGQCHSVNFDTTVVSLN